MLSDYVCLSTYRFLAWAIVCCGREEAPKKNLRVAAAHDVDDETGIEITQTSNHNQECAKKNPHREEYPFVHYK